MTGFLFGGGGAPSALFNVKDYGAVGNSTNYLNGNDDRAAIQAAVDAAAAIDLGGGVRGATVYLPRGIYHVSGPINFDTQRPVSMVGDDPGATGIGGSFADFVLNNEGQDGATLRSVRHLNVNNAYKNYLTSCSWASAGNASAVVASVSGKVLTVSGAKNIAITQITRSINTATIQTTANHGLTGTVTIEVKGAVQTAYNGIVSATVQTANTLSYAVSGSPATPATGTLTYDTIVGTVAVGQIITGAGVTYNSIIISLGTGTGGAGTYNLSKSSPSTGSIAVTASDTGIVTFGTQNAIDLGDANNITVGTQFHAFGMYPQAYIGRYIAVAGTTGSTLVGVGNCPTNPGTVTMLGAIGGGGIRMDTAEESTIEQCNVGAFNALHLGGSYGYGSNFATTPYNVFGLVVRDTVFGAGVAAEYGSVGAFCGQACFYSCSVSQTDWGVVASSNGFGFFNGHIENNRVGISIGRSDQLIPHACGAWSIVSNHTEDCTTSVEICQGNQGLMAANQWTGQHATGGTHSGIILTGTTAGAAAITNIAATVVTGNTTIHSPRITNLSTLTGLYNGMAISGTGIPAGSVILTFDSPTALTFINAAGTNESPLGASATGSTVTITATVAVGMRVGKTNGTNLPSNTCVASPIGSISAGHYDIVLNQSSTLSETASFNFNPTPLYGIQFTPSRLSGSVGNGVFIGNTTGAVAYSVAGVDLREVDGSPTFISHSSGPSTGLGQPWLTPQYGVAPGGSPSGVTYINSDNPSAVIPFAALPASPVEGMQFDIKDGVKSLGPTVAAGFGDTVISDGTGLHTHPIRVRWDGSNWTRCG